jgi:sarcosine oxidase, subunit beta
MSNTFDAVVVGAGVIGCSIAYHLTQAGLRTALIDQKSIGAGASGANFGMVQSNDVELDYSVPLVTNSYACFDTLEEELGCSLNFRRIGAISLIENEAQWKRAEVRQKALVKAGIPCEMISASQVSEIEPWVDTRDVIGASYAAYQAQVNPFLLMWGYVHRALPLGLSLHMDTEVNDFVVNSGRVQGVITNRGKFSAGITILATAAWTQRLGEKLGCSWRINHFRASAMATEPVKNTLIRNIISSMSHIELPVRGSRDAELTVFAATQLPEGYFLLAQANRSGDSLSGSTSQAAPRAMAMMASRYLPALDKIRVLRVWTAPTTFTDDGRPFFGMVEEVEDLLLATAFRSSIIITPLVGKLTAQLVNTGRCDLDISPFSPSREMGHADTMYKVHQSPSQKTT